MTRSLDDPRRRPTPLTRPALLLTSAMLLLLACSPGAGRTPQACGDDAECAPDAHCRDQVCVADAPPQAHVAGPSTAPTGIAVPFDGSASSDPDDGVDSYSWSVRVVSATCAPDPGVSNASTFHPVFPCPGSFEIILVVLDPTGVMSDPAAVPLTVEE